MLIDLPNNFSKPCIEHWKNQLCLHQSVMKAKQLFLSKVTCNIFILKKKFCLRSMAVIIFHHVKQWRLLHVGPCRIYKCLSGSGGSCKYCFKYVGNISKTNTAQCHICWWYLDPTCKCLKHNKRVTSSKFQQVEQEKKLT